MNIGLNLSDNNYLGSGNRFIFGINKSIYQESYNISFFDPYFTMDELAEAIVFILERQIMVNIILQII